MRQSFPFWRHHTGETMNQVIEHLYQVVGLSTHHSQALLQRGFDLSQIGGLVDEACNSACSPGTCFWKFKVS